MAFDYTEITGVVNELIPEFGRPISLLKTPRAPANAAEPWKGPASWSDPSPPAGHKLDGVSAIWVSDDATNLISQGSIAEFRDVADGLIRRGKSGFLVSGTVADDLTQFDRLDDGGKLWKIDAVNVLKPGPTVLLYGLEVSQ